MLPDRKNQAYSNVRFPFQEPNRDHLLLLCETLLGYGGSGIYFNLIYLVPAPDYRMHHVEPRRWNQGENHHAGIARRHLRGVIVVAQQLVLAAGLVMMIAVTTEFEEHHPPDYVIAVPTVFRFGALEFFRIQFFSC